MKISLVAYKNLLKVHAVPTRVVFYITSGSIVFERLFRGTLNIGPPPRVFN